MKSDFNDMKPVIHYNIIPHAMKTNSVLLASLRTIVLLAFLLNAALGWAADGNPPDRMTYQGYLTDDKGDPLGNTNTGPKNYDVIFRIYSDTTGNTPLWAEQQTLTVDKGYFSVLLGEGASYSSEPHPVLNTLFNSATASDRYIEVTVVGLTSAGSLTTIAPRLRLLTSPYAFLARTAVTANSANSLANGSAAQIVSIVGTNVGINKTPGSALDVYGTVTATGLKVNGTAGASSLFVTNNATINGTATAATLNVSGTAGISTLRVTNNETVSGSLTVTGTTTASNFVGYGTIPIGGIIMWSGSISTIPAGWALCNGQVANGYTTPNLTNRFVLAGSLTLAPGATGGATTHTLTVAEMPNHTHEVNHWTYSIRRATNPDGSYNIDQVTNSPTVSPAWSTATNGSGTAFSILPPYYALAYIMRVR